LKTASISSAGKTQMLEACPKRRTKNFLKDQDYNEEIYKQTSLTFHLVREQTLQLYMRKWKVKLKNTFLLQHSQLFTKKTGLHGLTFLSSDHLCV